MANFAIISFRSSGPIKSWSALRGAQVHNLREKPIEHGVPGAPPPFVLVGTDNLVEDVKNKLIEHHIDPHNLRENGVIAYEAVMTASPAFFDQGGDQDERDKLLFEWAAAQMSFALKKYGDRVASLVLHRDEETPHCHLIVVPLELVDDKRRKARGWRWSLVGSTISGPGKFDQLQDEYAEAMQTFGLVRGERGSEQKNEPYRVVMARVAEMENATEQQRRIWLQMNATTAEQTDSLNRKLAAADAAAAEVERLRKKVEDEARMVEKARLAVAKGRGEVLKAWDEINEEQAELDSERSMVRREMEIVAQIKDRAQAFTEALHTVQRDNLPPSIASALRAAEALLAGGASPGDRYAATAAARTVPIPFARAGIGMGD